MFIFQLLKYFLKIYNFEHLQMIVKQILDNNHYLLIQ